MLWGRKFSMVSTRPRIVGISEAIQLLLLCEPLWRAIKLGSAISVIGTSVIIALAAMVILQATRQRKAWARDLLAGLAVLSVLWLLAQVVLSYFSEQIAVKLQFLSATELFILVSNLIAVILLFTPQTIEWFCDGEPKSFKEHSVKGRRSSNAARVTITCPNCSQKIRVPVGRSGSIRCPPCGHSFTCCTVHIHDSDRDGITTDNWIVGSSDVSRETYEKLRDSRGDLYAIFYYEYGIRRGMILSKQVWETIPGWAHRRTICPHSSIDGVANE